MSKTRLALALCASVFALPLHAADLGGRYAVAGTNPDGASYSGALSVTSDAGSWKFNWQSGGESSGVGVQVDEAVAVAVGGAQCAVVLYQVRPDGALAGIWAQPTGGVPGSEAAVPVERPAGLAGEYTTEGTNPNGSRYRGALTVAREDEHWRLSWRGATSYEGYGLERDGYLGVSWGSPECGVVLYRQGADGALDGIWKYYRTGIGSERARRE